MKVGFVGSSGTVHQVLEMAQEAEDHGWDGFFTWDGISIGPMDTWDPWTLLGAAAVRTKRIRLGAMIFPLARRRPWKVAREALTVDHLSGGRLVLPVGLGVLDDGGFSRVSGEVTSARERAERLDEALTILERAWTGEPFSYSGRHHTVEDLVIRPTPVQEPRIPVWPVAGWRSERSMGRAARWDGALLQRIREDEPMRPREIVEAVAWMHERRRSLAATEGARLGDTFDVVVEGVLPDDGSAAADHLATLAEAGVTWWVEARWNAQRDTPASLLAGIRRGRPDG